MNRVLAACLAVVLLALFGAAAAKYAPGLRKSHDMRIFLDAYGRADQQGKIALASRYLEHYPVSDLLETLASHEKVTACHVDEHWVGRALYEKDSNLSGAITQCGTSCNYGCFHGVLMGLFSTDSDSLGGAINEDTAAHYLAQVKGAAKDLCTRPDVAGAVRQGACLHGLGHVFTYVADYDLDASLEACKIFADPIVEKTCAGGVFMEYMYNPALSETAGTKDAAPCDRYPSLSEQCFRYKARGWIAAWGGVGKAMNACQDLAPSLRRECIKGVSFIGTAPGMLDSQTGIDWMCGAMSAEDHKACTTGAILSVVINYGEAAAPMCDAMAPRYAGICRSQLQDYLAVRE